MRFLDHIYPPYNRVMVYVEWLPYARHVHELIVLRVDRVSEARNVWTHKIHIKKSSEILLILFASRISQFSSNSDDSLYDF